MSGKRISKGCLFQACFGFYGWAFLNFLSKGELVEHWSGVYHVSSLDFTAWFIPGHIKFEEFLNWCHFNFAYLYMFIWVCMKNAKKLGYSCKKYAKVW